jgi:hypothetical protein
MVNHAGPRRSVASPPTPLWVCTLNRHDLQHRVVEEAIENHPAAVVVDGEDEHFGGKHELPHPISERVQADVSEQADDLSLLRERQAPEKTPGRR